MNDIEGKTRPKQELTVVDDPIKWGRHVTVEGLRQQREWYEQQHANVYVRSWFVCGYCHNHFAPDEFAGHQHACKLRCHVGVLADGDECWNRSIGCGAVRGGGVG